MTSGNQPSPIATRELIEALRETRERTLELIDDLTDDQLMGPRLAIVNPLRWEIGHIAWFQEYWVLRHLGGLQPTLSQGESLYDSARVPHDTRWDLPLPSRTETLAYMSRVLDRVCDLDDERGREPIDGYDERYFLHLVLFHEQMHDEAITYTRQTLSYSRPRLSISSDIGLLTQGALISGDAQIPGGTLALGASFGAAFQFDNEQPSHNVDVAPFAISKTAVTNGEFTAFVEGGGYANRVLWSDEGWRWKQAAGADHPVYWQRESNGRWLRRDFSEWAPLDERIAVVHVNWFEANAYCRWAGRRLPTEAEWEMAASCELSFDGDSISSHKRRYSWGDDPPTPERANLDCRRLGCIDAEALTEGDSGFGCRQMIGNVWEWTATTFEGYPGFAPGPYKEYSEPWFGNHKVLRGGCWATRSRMIRSAYRNFYTPDRRDVLAGFRTCAP